MSFSPSILREREVELLAEERRLAGELGARLRGFQSSSEDAETLRRAPARRGARACTRFCLA